MYTLERALANVLPALVANDRFRHTFAEKANVVGPWIEHQLEAVAAIALGGRGTLEQALQRLHDLYHNVQLYKSNLDELERINQQLQESYIFENPFTRYTMETLRVGWETLITSLNKTTNEIENQVCSTDRRHIAIHSEHVFRFRS